MTSVLRGHRGELMTIQRILFLLVFAVAEVHAQSSGTTVAAPSPTTTRPFPLRIVETEGDTCAPTDPNYIVTWTFNSPQGEGKYVATQPVTLEHYDQNSLTVHRSEERAVGSVG